MIDVITYVIALLLFFNKCGVHPMLTLLPSTVVLVKSGHPFTLTCLTNNTVPPPIFHWEINGARVNESGSEFILRDIVVDSLFGQVIKVVSPTKAMTGIYRCVADNSYKHVQSLSSIEAHIFVTSPLPPTNFSIIKEGNCKIQLSWKNQMKHSANFHAAGISYLVEIQYITERGPVIQILFIATSSPVSTTIKFVNQNTSYMLRGQLLSMKYGNSDFSEWFGPFYAYTSISLTAPSITSMLFLAPTITHFTWSTPEGCYKIHNFTLECIKPAEPQTIVQVKTSNNAVIMRGLQFGSYDCRVVGEIFAEGINGNLVPTNTSTLYSQKVRTHGSFMRLGSRIKALSIDNELLFLVWSSILLDF